MKRNVYLRTRPLDEALKMWLEAVGAGPLEAETLRVTESQGRATAGPVFARHSSPFYHSSAMDGYALGFAETFGASERNPKRLEIGKDAFYVNTGDPMPKGLNAVVMVEDVNTEGGFIEIIEPLTPWKNVRVIGEDIVATEMIIPGGHTIRPVDIGAMLGGGVLDVSVRRRPKVAVVPTGSEVVEPGTEPGEGRIIEFNSAVMGGLVREWGGEFIRHPIVPDDLDEIKRAVLEAAGGADIVVVNAGASAGTRDYTKSAIEALGRVIFHGLSIKPGKPLVAGLVSGKPVLGVPGFPVSSYLTFVLFAKPLVFSYQGLHAGPPQKVRAVLSRQVASELGQEEFIRVKVGKVGENLVATPLMRGAGAMMSLVRSDGMLRVPALSEGLGAGSKVEIELMRPVGEIENTIVSIGSHDNALDVLSNALRRRHPKYSMSSAHVGSMGGLSALKRNEAHIAPTHLLDEETGLYNTPFIERILPGRRIFLVNLVYRIQGLIVRNGNPKGIKGFDDLARDDVVFINRQRGAGTRLLLDKHLKDAGIDPSSVKGYEREEYTHMAVASAVLSGVADAGLGVLSAARALGLDFIAVAEERYDLAIPAEHIGSEMLGALLEVIRGDEEFGNAVVMLGGYDTRDMGKVVYGE